MQTTQAFMCLGFEQKVQALFGPSTREVSLGGYNKLIHGMGRLLGDPIFLLVVSLSKT